MLTTMDSHYIPMFAGTGKSSGMPTPSQLLHLEDNLDGDDYEEPTQHHPAMPQPSAAPANNYRRVPPVSVVGPAPNHHTRRSLPPEPPELETYEDPHQEDSDEPEDYEKPVDFPSSRTPPPRIPTHPTPAPPRKKSPPSLPGTLPPRVPLRPKPEETYEIEDDSNGLDEDYEQPENAIVPQVETRSEIISAPGKLKPSNIARNPRVEIPKPEQTVVGLWLNQTGNNVPLRPSQLRERQAKTPSHHPKPVSDKPPPIPASNKVFSQTLGKPAHTERPSGGRAHVDRLPGLPGRTLPKPPEDQEMEGLYSYTWYHGDLTREVATEKLTARSQNGMFLVRKSTKAGSPYALSLFYGTRVYNLNIRLRADHKYALGTPKPDEKSFTGVPPLISYFQSNTLVLGGDTSTQTNLVHALPK